MAHHTQHPERWYVQITSISGHITYLSQGPFRSEGAANNARDMMSLYAVHRSIRVRQALGTAAP